MAQQEHLKSAIMDHCRRENNSMDWEKAKIVHKEWGRQDNELGWRGNTCRSTVGGSDLAAVGEVALSNLVGQTHLHDISWQDTSHLETLLKETEEFVETCPSMKRSSCLTHKRTRLSLFLYHQNSCQKTWDTTASLLYEIVSQIIVGGLWKLACRETWEWELHVHQTILLAWWCLTKMYGLFLILYYYYYYPLNLIYRHRLFNLNWGAWRSGPSCFWNRYTVSPLCPQRHIVIHPFLWNGGTETSVRHSVFISQILSSHPPSVSHSAVFNYFLWLIWNTNTARVQRRVLRQQVPSSLTLFQPWPRRSVLLARLWTSS